MTKDVPKPPVLGRYCFKIWLPILSIGLPILVAEVTCRAFRLAPPPRAGFAFYVRRLDNDLEHDYMVGNSQTLWSPRPGYVEPECRINSAGFRGPEYSIEKPPDVLRILCLGDSSTFGFLVDDSETYPAQLESRLNADRAPGRVRYEVINGGVTGYTSAQCLALFRSKAYKYRPDLVTVWVGPNDMKQVYTLNDRQLLAWRQTRRSLAASRVRDFLEWFHSYRTVYDLVRKAAPPAPPDEQPGRIRVDLDDFQKNLAALNDLCLGQGSRLVLISFAQRSGDRADERTTAYRRALEEVARKERIPLLIPDGMTDEAKASNADLFIDTVHPNPKGHGRIAEQLKTFLETEVLR